MLLLDAYNILHIRGVLPPRLAGIEVPGLIRLIEGSRYAGQPLRLVCDGRRPPTDRATALSSGEARVTIGTAEVWYAGEGREADAVIEEILRTDSAARRMLVVSSDRRIRRAASRARAGTIDSETFLRHLVHDEALPHRGGLPEFATAIPLDGYSVAYWIREFGVGEDWLKIGAAGDEKASAIGPGPIAGSAGRERAAQISALQDAARRGAAPGDSAAGRAAVPGQATPDWVAEALRLWGDRLRLDDLDMHKWIKE